jgi:ubiquinone/menaquinone biosynthesis C-methylase UbiE
MAGESKKPALAGDADKVGRHYDKICELEVSRLETWSPVEYGITLRYLKRYVPDGVVVAEVGVGAGHYSESLARRGCTLHLVDVSQRLLAVAASRLNATGLLDRVASATHGSATDMSFLVSGTMDAVLFLGPLYHLRELAERQSAVAEAARILKAGGILFAAGINRLSYLRDMFRPLEIASMQELVEEIQTLFRREMHEGKFPAEYLATGCLDPKHAPPIGWAHMTNVAEFRSLFVPGFEELTLVGLESFTSPAPDHLSRIPAEDRELWLDLVEKTGATTEGLAYSDHFLFIGRRK